MARSLRIGLIGAGEVTRFHAMGYRNVPDAKVVAVADTMMAQAEQRAKELGADGVYDSADGLLKDEKVEAVDICVPGGFHAPIAVAAAEAGKLPYRFRPQDMGRGVPKPKPDRILNPSVVLILAPND